jgi:hypothetical protein
VAAKGPVDWLDRGAGGRGEAALVRPIEAGHHGDSCWLPHPQAELGQGNGMEWKRRGGQGREKGKGTTASLAIGVV